MKNIGNVTNAKILSRQRRVKGKRSGPDGLSITFKTNETITNKSIVMLNYNNEEKPFKVYEVKIEDGMLECDAIETGYFASMLGKSDSLDIRSIIGSTIDLVTDKKEIANINESSLYT